MAISHIGHVELRVPDVAASMEFMRDLIGLQVTSVEGDCAYLRAWQDWDHHTLQLTEAPDRALGHVGWRAADREEVLRVESELERRGIESTWLEGSSEVGHGDALRFVSAGGLPYELYWEVQRFEAPAADASRFPSRPARRRMGGAGTRRLDHVGTNVDDVAGELDFLTGVLGMHHRYYGTLPDGSVQFSWLSCNNVPHEISLVRNGAGNGAQFHHLAYYMESTEDILRAAMDLVDYGFAPDWGPGQHGTEQSTALYVKEPGGHRIELSTGGMLIFAPDWQPIHWEGEVLYAVGDIWGNAGLSEEFLTGTPVATELPLTEGA